MFVFTGAFFVQTIFYTFHAISNLVCQETYWIQTMDWGNSELAPYYVDSIPGLQLVFSHLPPWLGWLPSFPPALFGPWLRSLSESCTGRAWVSPSAANWRTLDGEQCCRLLDGEAEDWSSTLTVCFHHGVWKSWVQIPKDAAHHHDDVQTG